MSRYRLAALAQSDLDDIWLHIAQDASIETAGRIIDEIVQRFALLAENPRAGRLREDIAPGIRSFPEDSADGTPIDR
jgi:toxin ParE1/3/4